MKVIKVNGKEYRVPGSLNPFQQDLYLHLIDWKRRNITTEAGMSGGILYDAILPREYQTQEHCPLIYPCIRQDLARHRAKNPFRIHLQFYHIASSQAAAVNLFLPILTHPQAAAILARIKPDIASLATDQLDNGYCIEYWGGNFDGTTVGQGKAGPLADKSTMAGTDADIAIAYRNHQGTLCLWLIEHKLTEKEFTTCGGAKSKGRRTWHNCRKRYEVILADPSACYYHDACRFRYWEVTRHNRAFFAGSYQQRGCPFRDGLNQLWRNQLLGLAIEQDPVQPFAQTYFSVVKHPDNEALETSLTSYKRLITDDSRFSIKTSEAFVTAAEQERDADINEWAEWYRSLYRI